MVKAAGLLAVCVLVASCGGGGGGGGSTPPPPPPQTFTVGGTVTGLNGTGLVLENNGGNPLTVNADGMITFSTALTSGSPYNVTVRTQPTASPAQTCTVSSGAGTVASAPVTTVAVQCRALVGRYVYVATAAQNAVAAFTIDATTGALTPLGAPFLTAGQAPRALFTAHMGRFLYVLGDDNVSGPGATSLTGFVVNQQTGALAAISQLVNLEGTFFSGGQHPNGNFVYIPVSDPTLSANNRLRGFAIDATTGMLTNIPGSPWAIAGDEVLNSAVLSPNGANLYLASSTPTVPPSTPPSGRITRFTVDASTGALTATSPAVTMANNSFNGLFMHPAGTHMYTRNSTSQAHASRLTLNAATGEIGTRVDIPSPLRFGFGLVIGPVGRVYFPELGGTFGAPAPGSVRGYADAASGAITELVGSPYQTNGSNSLAAALDPTGRFLALTNLGTADVTVMRVDPTSGALTHIPGSPYTPAVGNQPGSVTFDPSGRFAYLTDGVNSISSYSIDAATGVPTFADSELLQGSPAVVPVTVLGLQ